LETHLCRRAWNFVRDNFIIFHFYSLKEQQPHYNSTIIKIHVNNEYSASLMDTSVTKQINATLIIFLFFILLAPCTKGNNDKNGNLF